MKPKEIRELIKRTIQEFGEDKAPRLAAALAYYTIFSIAPLLVIVISIAGFIIGSNEVVQEQLIDQVGSLAGTQTAEQVNDLIARTNKPQQGVVGAIVGVVTLLFGATGLFGQLQSSLNAIWDVEEKPSGGILGMVKDRFLSFTMVLGLSFLLLVSLVISAGLAIVNNYFSGLLGGAVILAQAINFIFSTAVITLVFALIFKILPEIEIAWSDVWVGALITALLFNVGKSLIGLYLGNSAVASVYGAAGSLIVLLLWVYYSAQILFLGAEFTQVYARRFGSQAAGEKDVQPAGQAEGARAGAAQPQAPPRGAAQVMIPVVGQPALHPAPAARERIRYRPPNPAPVVPVIAMGLVSGVYTIYKIARRMVS
jgi:membrane protein